MATTFAVPDGRVAMAATTYTGSGGTNTISNAVNGVGLQPDLLWTKSRSSAAYHYIQNSVVGVNKALYSNTTDSEYTLTTTTTALNTNGFSFNGPESGLNASAATYVGWQWKAGAAAVSNTAGTITSSVSANTTAGFSVVTYTGTGAGTSTVGHGLGVAPSLIIVKNRSAAGSSWAVYHASIPTQYLTLNTTTGASAGQWISSTATTISYSSLSSWTNTSAATYVAYCWAPVAGYSAFGSYTGNGSADGPFIYTGFRPRWLMIKRTDYVAGYGDWYIWDSARNIYNSTNSPLSPDTSAIENANNSSLAFDMVSNGFKLRSLYQDINNSGTTYIYAAFAENPLKYSNAR